MNTRKYSKAQEKHVAKTHSSYGGKVQANSGATMFQKGDVVLKDWLIECKTAVTEKLSMSIKKDWIEKLKLEKFSMNKPFWALIFNFGGLGNKENYYIIDERMFSKLLELLQKESEEV